MAIKHTPLKIFLLFVIYTWGINEVLAGSWEEILSRGNTICAGGSPYAFYVRKTKGEKLLIYFQSGGACVEGFPCNPDDPKMFDPSVALRDDKKTHSETIWDHDDPENLDGIFNLHDKRNPFLDYNMVFIPYCTADLHLGNRVYKGVHHNGYNNAMSALKWTYENFQKQERVLVLGSSAGAIAAPYYAISIAKNYPNATMAVLSDSLGGIRIPLLKTMQNWGMSEVLLNTSAYEKQQAGKLNFETMLVTSAKRLPQIPFAQFNTDKDKVQKNYLMASGIVTPVSELISANQSYIRSKVNNFHTYTVKANYHVILSKTMFYKEKVGDAFFYQWVGLLASGKKPENIN